MIFGSLDSSYRPQYYPLNWPIWGRASYGQRYPYPGLRLDGLGERGDDLTLRPRSPLSADIGNASSSARGLFATEPVTLARRAPKMWICCHPDAPLPSALFFAPGTGSLRFEKGRIFTLLLISAVDGLGSVKSFEVRWAVRNGGDPRWPKRDRTMDAYGAIRALGSRS